jgi:UPF0271 protein
MSPRVDLNCDLGELEGAEGWARELALLPWVTSINLACGLHAGDPQRIRLLAQAARAAGVAVGAHPGYPDRAGFGRVELELSPEAIRDWVLYQVAAVGGMLKAEGVLLNHVKPHGALYNRAYRDREAAHAIAEAVAAYDPECWLVAQAGSELAEAGGRIGLHTAREVFADRGYAADGSLLRRGTAGSVMTDPEAVAARAVKIVSEQAIPLADGSRIAVPVDTICLHGDNPKAGEIARRLMEALRAAGVELAALPPRPRPFRVRN